MKRPSFQFYPSDWQGNSNLRRCTHAEKGIWLDLMCLMHDSEEYGMLRWNLKEIAQAVGCKLSEIKALITKGVLKGCDSGACEPFVYTPRSGRKDGDSVTLVGTQDGPIWYSSRMVRDEYVRSNAGASTRFGAEKAQNDQPTSKSKETDRAKLRSRVLEKTGGLCYHCNCRLGDAWEIDHLHPRSKGGRHTFANMVPSCVACNQDKSDTLPDDWAALNLSPSRRDGANRGDGSTSSSSSSPSVNPSDTSLRSVSATDGGGGTSAKTAKTAEQMTKDELWACGKSLLEHQGMPKAQCGSFVGKLVKDYGPDVVVDAVRSAVVERPADAAGFLKKTCMHRASKAEKPSMHDIPTRDAFSGHVAVDGAGRPLEIPKNQNMEGVM